MSRYIPLTEGGNIGWGLPEAMGEVMARHEGLAGEYVKILESYIREDGNFLEHPVSSIQNLVSRI